MMKREYIGGIGLAFLVAVLFSPVVAVGQYLIAIDYTVSGSPEKKGTITTDLDWDIIKANPNTTYVWNFQPSDPFKIDLGGGDSAEIDGLSMSVKADPVINFGFSVIGGQSDTTFLLASNLLPVNPALINAQGSARATGVSVADGTLTGNYGGKVYRAEYNGGTVFTDLVEGPLYDGDSVTASVGSTPISGSVSSMQSVWSFTLSGGNTSASGQSRFTITGNTIPEPATMCLLGLGAALISRRKRS
jgi:hypothetical protein